MRYKGINLFFVAPYYKEYKNLIKKFKFYKKTHLYRGLSYMMVSSYLRYKKVPPKIVIPMPIGPIKMRQRGFNQCKLLAKGISDLLGVETKEFLLRKDGKQLSLTNSKDRSKFINGLMYFDKKINLENKGILVIDDIYTTGATMRESLKILGNRGLKDVEYLFLARQEAKINLKKWFSQ